MARPAIEFLYGYEDIRKLTNLTYANIKSHKKRGSFDPADLRSVVLFLARHGKLELRKAIVEHALMREKELPKAGATVKRKKA